VIGEVAEYRVGYSTLPLLGHTNSLVSMAA
jgi:hypothetical protein